MQNQGQLKVTQGIYFSNYCDHEDYAINCLACNFRCTSQEELEIHIVSTHSFPCKTFSAVFQTDELLRKHIPSHQQQTSTQMNDSVKCDQCGFRSNSINEFITHILDKHKKHPEMIECQHFDYKAHREQCYWTFGVGTEKNGCKL